MRKTLGDYNIEKSSSSDLNNISWSQKKLNEDKKPRKKKIVKEGQICLLYTSPSPRDRG